MASFISRILCALSILQYAVQVNEETDLSTRALQRQLEAEQAELQQQLMWLQQPREPREAEPLALWQHYGWWAAAGILLLLLGLLRLRRKRRAAPDSGSQRLRHCGAVSGGKEEEGPARHTRAHAASSPLFGCRGVSEEAGDGGDLLQALPENNFTTGLHTALRAGSASKRTLGYIGLRDRFDRRS